MPRALALLALILGGILGGCAGAPATSQEPGFELGGETWILDSRAPEIYPMSAPRYAYRWERRQIPGTVAFAPVEA